MTIQPFALMDGSQRGHSCGHCGAELTEPDAVVAQYVGREDGTDLLADLFREGLEDDSPVWSRGSLVPLSSIRRSCPECSPLRAGDAYAFCAACDSPLLERR